MPIPSSTHGTHTPTGGRLAVENAGQCSKMFSPKFRLLGYNVWNQFQDIFSIIETVNRVNKLSILEV